MGHWPIYVLILALLVEGTIYLYAPNHRRDIVHVTPKPSKKPVPKVTAAALGGALVTVALYVVGLFDITVPAEVAAAATTLIAFAAGWIKR